LKFYLTKQLDIFQAKHFVLPEKYPFWEFKDSPKQIFSPTCFLTFFKRYAQQAFI
jgi:hypothetical protein